MDIKASYMNWTTFKIRGKRFLALETRNKVQVYGEKFSVYGAWMTVDSFKKKYAKEGEALCLDQ